MNKLHQLKEYLCYRWRARGPHGIHSPYVFHLVNSIFLDHSPYYAFESIEKARGEALKDHTLLKITDFGAGSQVSAQAERRVSEIARTSLLPPHFAQILFKLVDQSHPEYILELGTSLGFTTAYFASASHRSEIFTLEGCPAISSQSEKLFKKLELKHIQVITGEFNETLYGVLSRIPYVDFAFVDGNHRLEPTLEYFNVVMEKTRENSILVFDDIHWSPAMSEAWKRIRNDPRISLSLDLFRFGLVFIRPGFPKQHFVLKNGWPW